MESLSGAGKSAKVHVQHDLPFMHVLDHHGVRAENRPHVAPAEPDNLREIQRGSFPCRSFSPHATNVGPRTWIARQVFRAAPAAQGTKKPAAATTRKMPATATSRQPRTFRLGGGRDKPHAVRTATGTNAARAVAGTKPSP